jgi:hypothetical protein
MDLREFYEALRDVGAVASMNAFDAGWLGQRPGYTKRGGCSPRRAGLPALLRLAGRLDQLASTQAVAPLRALRSALGHEIMQRVAGDAAA